MSRLAPILHIADLDGYTLTGEIESVDSDTAVLTIAAPGRDVHLRSIYVGRDKARQIAAALSDWAES